MHLMYSICPGLKAFFTTPQLTTADKAANALALGTSPIVRSLIDPEGGMRDVRWDQRLSSRLMRMISYSCVVLIHENASPNY